MANSILSSLFGKVAMIVTNDDTGLTLWSNFKVKTVEISNEAAATDQPLSLEQFSDQGTTLSLQSQDLETVKILRPARMRIVGFAADIDTLESILQTFGNVTGSVSISTKSVIVTSMIPVEIDIEQTPEMLSASKVTIDLEQFEPPEPEAYDPAQSGDVSTLGIRIQTPPSLTASVSALYNTVSSAF